MDGATHACLVRARTPGGEDMCRNCVVAADGMMDWDSFEGCRRLADDLASKWSRAKMLETARSIELYRITSMDWFLSISMRNTAQAWRRSKPDLSHAKL
jgi:hypothetical protein